MEKIRLSIFVMQKKNKNIDVMKKFELLLLTALAIPTWISAQNDDIYYTPGGSKDVQTVTTSNQSSSTLNNNNRDVNAYNNRYSTGNTYNNNANNDTLYIDDNNNNNDTIANNNANAVSNDNENGHWVNGFTGDPEDYEYASRIIRFHDPRYAINVLSPLYWDVVYGLNSWDWNVYDHGIYAYAFPTSTNRLW